MTTWNKLKDKKPVGNGPFLYFPVKVSCGYSIQVSSGGYLRGPYVDKDVLQWAEIDKPEGYKDFEDKRHEWDK